MRRIRMKRNGIIIFLILCVSLILTGCKKANPLLTEKWTAKGELPGFGIIFFLRQCP
jgi:hypothetical protein